MRITFSGKNILNRVSNSTRFNFSLTRRFCSSKQNNKLTNGSSSSNQYEEQYRALKNLDFMTAAKILFTDPPKKKKFGLDFHLVQLFFVCLPSLAVYLVAMYARGEMKKMDAELELKKQAEFEAQAKEMELKAAQEKEAAKSDPELLEVKERLKKLEETIKEIAVESKKQSSDAMKKDQGNTNEQKQDAQTKSPSKESTAASSEGKN